MGNMKRLITILGILVTITILISGSVIAQPIWHYVDHYEPAATQDCTNPNSAEDFPDNEYATVGINSPQQKTGFLVLDLGTSLDDWMGPNQDFTVWGFPTGINETYTVAVLTHDGLIKSAEWPGWDSDDLVFTTPSTPDRQWRYFQINGTSGFTSWQRPDDPIYGPEIDAVGWYG
jgi:hypothetical protein